MDPNKALADIRLAVQAVCDGEVSRADAETVLYALAATVNGLDEWLSYGGFLPTDWTRA